MTEAETACCCCGTQGPQRHLGILLRCTACTHVWADVSITLDQARALYGQGYFQGDEYLDYEREEPALRRNFRRCVRDLRALAPTGGRLFEIGAAYGFFLHEAAAHFHVAGCDISAPAAARARERFGLDVRCLDYLGHTLDQPQDVICMWDTVEHLAHPERTLAKAHRDLVPGGALALSTGDIGALAARIRGPRWRLIHVPTHLHYFTTRSMTTLLEGLGFEVLRIHHPAFWRTADAVAHQVLNVEGSSRRQRLFQGLQRARLLDFSFPLNTLDLMTVYARK